MRIVVNLIALLVFALPAVAHAQGTVAQGAIHAMGGPHRYRHHHRRYRHAWRHAHRGRHLGIALPPGTSRPGPSRNFIPAR